MNTNDKDRQDRVWITRIAAQGPDAEQALRALHDQYRRPLLRFVMHKGATPETADEVVQDTFVKVWNAAGSYRGDAQVSSWLHTIAVNTFHSVVRRTNIEDTRDDEGWQALEREMADDGKMLAPCDLAILAAEIAHEALKQCYDGAFAQFAERHPEGAQALELVVQNKWSMRELAGALQRSEGATREFVSQCKKKLKHFLEPCAPLLKELA